MLSLTKEERLTLVCLGAVLLLGILANYLLKVNPASKKFFNSASDEVPRHLKVDANKATYDELLSIPYIGEKIAESILKLREEKGRFTDLSDIRYIKGVGKFKFSIIEKYLTIGP